MPPNTARRHGDAPQPIVLTADDERDLRTAQLELLAEFDRVCTANGLEYFALYGTLLGAVRHGGFIPWDDDLDVGMLRADFDRLAEVVEADLGADYFFQTVRSDPHFGCMFAKLRKRDTRCVDRISYGTSQHGGIFIDVFPLDAKATGWWSRLEQRLMRNVGFRLLYIKAGYGFMKGTSLPSRVAQALARATARVLPRRLVVAMMERHARLGGTDPEQYVSLYGAYVYDRDTVDASWIHPLQRIPFEDVTIPAFADTDAYLTQVYGDYRQPPPPEQRVGYHEIVELDFGAGRR